MATTGPLNSIAAGIACGAGAALFWAAGFTAAKHGIDVGFSPADLAFHRFFWSGVVLLPLVIRDGIADLNGIGWGRGIVLTILGGPGLAIISYSGFLLVPLGHGGVIQPSCAAVGGLLLAALVLKEKLPVTRIVGAGVIVGGLVVIGGEALATIGVHGLAGDLMFMVAGFFFATFGMLLRLWHMAPTRATVVVSAVSLGFIPLYWLFHGFETMLALGWRENLLQAVMQGILAGPGAIYLFARAVVLLGAGRAAVFPSLVPGFTLLIGFLALGIVPSLFQLLGFAIVLAGFRLTQKG
ncbi:MAG: DMT family transporter [Pseudomonadota bacterium]